MKFRTEIEIRRKDFSFLISHADSLLMLGSCFTDEIGSKLDIDGFNVTRNPMGPLFNPASIANALQRATGERLYTADEFARMPDGSYHCLDFASRYQDSRPDALAERVNTDILALGRAARQASVAVITLGASHVFTYRPTMKIAGNCHKFPASDFQQSMLSTEQSVRYLTEIVRCLPEARMVIFTISPIRHLAYGLHGNNLSKARLMLAVDEIASQPSSVSLDYFPAFEILCDDLRDYRFYAPDLKHPSATAVDYIYERFGECYFSKATAAEALVRRAARLRTLHRQKN